MYLRIVQKGNEISIRKELQENVFSIGGRYFIIIIIKTITMYKSLNVP